MSLTNLSQIKSLKNLRGEVDLLLQSYDAAKVLTQIAKAEGEGSYNVEELLTALKAKLDAIQGESGEGQSLESLKKSIDELKNKELAGIIYNADYSVLNPDSQEYIQGTVKLGAESEFDKSNLENILIRTAKNAVDGKAYEDALAALVTKLAANKELINAVKALIGDEGVKAQIDAAVKTMEDALALKGDKADVDKTSAAAQVLDTQIKALEDGAMAEVQDVVALGDLQVALPMAQEANDRLVRVYVNGAVYYEGDDFTVDRQKQEVNWTLADFELTKAIASKVTVKYYASLGLGEKPEEPFDPSMIQVDDSKIFLTREEPEKSFNVTIPADCTLEVVPSDPEAVEVTVTEVQ